MFFVDLGPCAYSYPAADIFRTKSEKTNLALNSKAGVSVLLSLKWLAGRFEPRLVTATAHVHQLGSSPGCWLRSVVWPQGPPSLYGPTRLWTSKRNGVAMSVLTVHTYESLFTLQAHAIIRPESMIIRIYNLNPAACRVETLM